MKKAIAALILVGLGLGGCVTTSEPVRVIVREQVVYIPPEELFERCRALRENEFPEVRGLTDLQVARLIEQLHKMNVNCETDIRAIRRALQEAKKRVQR